MIKKSLFGLVAILISLQALAATPINRIVAIVNDSVITQSQLNHEVAFIKANLEKNNTKLPPESVLADQVLQQMILKKLQLQLAARTGIQISEMDVTKAINTLAQKNHKTVAEMYQSVATLGLSRAQFRQDIRDELTTNKLQERDIASKITITPEEVSDYLRSNAGQALDTTQYHLATILIALPDAPTAQQIASASTQANVIVSQLKKGANFKRIAMSDSKSQNALQGGDLGYKQLLELPSVFAAQVVKMKDGQIAGPIKTANGFYIIKLLDTRTAAKSKKLSPDQLKLKVENLIFQRKLQERLQNWDEQLRSGAYVKIFPAT